MRISFFYSCNFGIDRHTFDVLATIMHEIICKFKLNGKVTSIVTYNRSNFVKAFREFNKPQVQNYEDSDSDVEV